MKFIKNALTPPIVAISVLLLSISVADAAIYLKADAPDGGNGASWSTAFNTYRDALAALREVPVDGDATLYIAKGLYAAPSSSSLSATDPTVVSNVNFRIVGGYRASEDGDMERDPEVYQTIITGASVANLRKATWTRLSPVPGTFTLTKTTGVAKILDENDNLQFPAYEGEHDTFTASTSGGYIPLYIYGKEASGTVDGLKFVCWNRGSSRSGLVLIGGGAAGVTITNCVFAGSCPQGGCIALGAPPRQSDLRLVVDCKFMYNWVSYGTLGVEAPSKGRTIIRDCSFVGCSRQASASMALINASGGDNVDDVTAEDCVFTRNLTMFSSASSMILSGAARGVRLVVTNNYSSVSAAGGAMLCALTKMRYTMTGQLEGCLFADNYFEFKPTADTAAVLVNCYGSGQDENVPLVKDCLFRDNELVADATGIAEGNEFAAGVVGNSGIAKTVRATVIGCTFVSNRVSSVNLADGAKARRTNGVLVYGSASKSIQYGIANCTFFGPHEGGLPGILQYKAQYDTMNVVNCIFADDDPNATSVAFEADDPGKLKVYDCTVQNLYPLYQPTDFGVWQGAAYDPVPFVPVDFVAGDARTLRPSAKTPDLRIACDIATNLQVNSSYSAPLNPVTFVFRTSGDEGWQLLTPKAQALKDNEKEPALDAFGAARAFGATTRGAVQGLTETAESGASLTLRSEPALSCTFSAPANQSVAAGAAIMPVTATSDLAFKGWYDGDSLYTDANPLVIESLSEDLLLTAKFAAKQTKLTFDLGEHGTFVENGEHEITVEADAASEFPEIPAFTVEDGWVFVTWGELPRIVPDDDASYRAKIVTKAKRTFFVAPVASGTGDGSSWENATDDFAAAYADAAAYVGEVRLWKGCYRIAIPMQLRSNVAIVGGFGDGETVFTGDVNGDDYWKVDGTTTSAGPVWSDGTFNCPAPDGRGHRWEATSASADNANFCFEVAAETAVTNATFSGVVFTGFAKAAVFTDARSDSSGLAFENCRFLANGTAADDNYKAITVSQASPMALTDCEFVGNHGGVLVKFTLPDVTNSLMRCTFAFNTAACLSKTIGSAASGVAFNVSDSSFTNNWSSGCTFLATSTSKNHGPSRFTNCTVSGNYGRLIAASGSNAGDSWPNPNLEFDACTFTDNSRANLTADSSYLLIGGGDRYYPVIFRDCYIAGNCCTNTGSGVLALAYTYGYHRYTFLDCTIEKNVVVSTAAGGRSAITCLYNVYGGVNVAGSLFADNEVTAVDPANAADVMLAHASQSSSSGFILDCVIDETKYGQFPLRVKADAVPVSVYNSAIRGLDLTTCGGKVTTNEVFVGDALVEAKSSVGPNGVRARGLRGETPCRCLGVAFWYANNDNYYYRRLTDTNYKPIGASAGNSSTDGGKKIGMFLEGPYLPDAWGRQRKRRTRIAPGPLNAPDLGLMLLVK